MKKWGVFSQASSLESNQTTDLYLSPKTRLLDVLQRSQVKEYILQH